LTLSDFDVLVQLFHAGGNRLRRIDLARQVLLSASGITRLLDGLERAGWVEKAYCDSDGRVTYAQLTEAGMKKIAAARKTHHADIEALFSAKFAADEITTLDELLGRLPLADTECAK
jgi:DNA-binding MarR family transcriptional regulator